MIKFELILPLRCCWSVVIYSYFKVFNPIFMLPAGKIYSIINSKCPRCNQGKLYKQANPYRSNAMESQCSHCGQDFTIETGFYFGAMYVSYAFNVAIAVVFNVLMIVVWKRTVFEAMAGIVFIMIGLSSVLVRYSRNIWLNMFVKYQKQT